MFWQYNCRCLRKLIADKDKQWDDYLQSVVFSINTSKSATTKFSPFYLMYGRQARFPFEVDVLDKDATPQQEQVERFREEWQPYDKVIADHKENMLKIQQEIFPTTIKNIENAQEKHKKQYLKRKGLPDIAIKNGVLIL